MFCCFWRSMIRRQEALLTVATSTCQYQPKYVSLIWCDFCCCIEKKLVNLDKPSVEAHAFIMLKSIWWMALLTDTVRWKLLHTVVDCSQILQEQFWWWKFAVYIGDSLLPSLCQRGHFPPGTDLILYEVGTCTADSLVFIAFIVTSYS